MCFQGLTWTGERMVLLWTGRTLGGILEEFGWFGGMLEDFVREKYCSG